MTKTELAKLLTMASLIDHRKITPEMVEAWYEIIGDLDVDLAHEAMILARKDPQVEYLEPRHIAKFMSQAKVNRYADVGSARARRIVPASWPDSLPLPASFRDQLKAAREEENAQANRIEMRELLGDIEDMSAADQAKFLPLLKELES